MPLKLMKNPDGTYKVKNTETGKIHAFSTTKKAGEAQIRLLTSIERRRR